MNEIINVETLVRKVEEINSIFSGQVWWRGQNNFKWKLEPSVFRSEYTGYSEKSGVQRFMHKAQSRHLLVPQLSDRQHWLFLMQHYGLPTRLLDWTESPLIACYFATEPDHDKTDGALYALSPYALNKIQTGHRSLLMPYDAPAIEIIDSVFKENLDSPKKIVAIRPMEVDIRLLTQISVFTLHGHNELIEKMQNAQDFIIKIKVPKGSKRNLREQLKHLGVRASNIFPDLDHLAKEVKMTKFKNSVKSNISLEDGTPTVVLESAS